MRVITKKIKAYSYEELPDNIKEKILSKQSEQEYHFNDDLINTLNEFCKLMNCSWKEYDLYYHKNIIFDYENIDYDYNDNELNLDSLNFNQLHNYLKNKIPNKLIEESYSLTGVFLDYDILNPLIQFIKKPYKTTYKELLSDCFNGVLKSAISDYENQISEESIIEQEHEYCSDGEIIN